MWFPVMHIVMLEACLICLYRVEALPWKCVHLQSTCFGVACGDIVEISLHGVWVGCVIPPFPGALVKAHNLVNCADLTVCTTMKHAHGLVTVDFDVPVSSIGHYDIKHTQTCNGVIHSHQSFIFITV